MDKLHQRLSLFDYPIAIVTLLLPCTIGAYFPVRLLLWYHAASKPESLLSLKDYLRNFCIHLCCFNWFQNWKFYKREAVKQFYSFFLLQIMGTMNFFLFSRFSYFGLTYFNGRKFTIIATSTTAKTQNKHCNKNTSNSFSPLKPNF